MTRTKLIRRMVLAGIVLCVALLIFSGVAIDSSRRLDEQKRLAHEKCKRIAIAADAYMHSPFCGWMPFPPTLNDLAHPPEGPSYLRNGESDLIDPWGKPFQLQIHGAPEERRATSLHVLTTAPDGTPISQHGIGADAVLRE